MVKIKWSYLIYPPVLVLWRRQYLTNNCISYASYQKYMPANEIWYCNYHFINRFMVRIKEPSFCFPSGLKKNLRRRKVKEDFRGGETTSKLTISSKSHPYCFVISELGYENEWHDHDLVFENQDFFRFCVGNRQGIQLNPAIPDPRVTEIRQ